MNDLYLELAHSQVGKSVFEALNLPKPPTLFRSPNLSLFAPKGRVLVAGVKNNFAFKHILKALSTESVKLCAFQADEAYQKFFSTVRCTEGVQVEQITFNKNSNHRIKSFVFDASGLSSSKDLAALYTFFHTAIRSIKNNGRIVVIGQLAKPESSVEEAALSSALEGFVKSLAKEVGKKGVTCNLLKIEKGAERQIQSALYYFMTDKAAFVTGQALNLVKGRSNPRKINWNKPLTGKTALVTGAAQGIGAETARVLARDGACVVCLDIPMNEAKTKALAEEINGHAIAIDLSDDNAAEQITTTIASQLGVLDVVVHNAGITRDKTMAKMPSHFWDQVIDINLSKILEINQSLTDKILLTSRAKIICISSISGIAGNFGQTNYAASKAGIAGYVEALAPRLENGVTINAIAPGFIETQMTKQVPVMTRQVGRRSNSFSQGGETLDVAEAVSLFCHPGSQALNGNVLRVCGQSLLGK